VKREDALVVKKEEIAPEVRKPIRINLGVRLLEHLKEVFASDKSQK
jgi:hypothetical protein